MKIAVVILNWNGEKMLSQYLPTVVKYSCPTAEVFVADNASTDGSVDLLIERFPTVRQIVLDQNWGFADGYNKALQHIDAEYYILLNSDIEVTPHWLNPLIDFMDNHPEVAACQPKLLSIFNRQQFEYAGAAGGYIDRYGYPFCRGRIFDVIENDTGQYDRSCKIAWATGACFMIRAKAYWEVGGLDGRFFAHNEEIDLCWRLRLAGYDIYCVPDSKVYHVGGGTLPKKNPMKTYLNFRNNLTMLYKNLDAHRLRRVMRMRWWLDYLAALQMFILECNRDNCKAVFKARKDFKRWRHDFDLDRQKIQRMRQVDDQDILSPYSVLWQFHVKRKRKYTQLR